MEMLEDIEDGAYPRERRGVVVDADEHRALPLCRVARRLGRSREMKELRQGRRGQLRVGEVQLAELVRKLRGGFRVIRIDSQLHEERLDEAGIAALVHA